MPVDGRGHRPGSNAIDILHVCRYKGVLTAFSVVPFSCSEAVGRTDNACTLSRRVSRSACRIRSSLYTRIPCDCRKTAFPPRCRRPRSSPGIKTENRSLLHVPRVRYFPIGHLERSISTENRGARSKNRRDRLVSFQF